MHIYCGWECILELLRGNTKKLKTNLPHDKDIMSLGVYLMDSTAYLQIFDQPCLISLYSQWVGNDVSLNVFVQENEE